MRTPPPARRRFPSRRIGPAVIVAAVIVLAACATPPPADTPVRNQALYVEMRDGVRIAVDVWLPEGLAAGSRLPTIMRATRYWRAQDRVGAAPEDVSNFAEAGRFNSAGYALVLVDARGSGASFGVRRFELAEDEVADYGEVVDWIIAQPWSNGRVGAYGVSYAGNTAEMLTVNMHPAVKAVAPLFNDFDNFGHLVFPGGLLDIGFLEGWSASVARMDQNDVCALAGAEGDACDEVLAQVTGVKPVDADTSGLLLARAVHEHAANTVPFESALEYSFRDDPFGPFGETHVGHRRSPSGHLPRIEESGAAMFIRAGWQDAATVNGTLGRYNTISNPQQVYIGPWDHGAGNDADPFLPVDTPVRPTAEEQFTALIEFFDAHLAEGGSRQTPTEINYYTMGAEEWTRTEVWPPEGFDTRSWYFAPGGALRPDPPDDGAGTVDTYAVDFSATTGASNRWATNGGAGDVIYGDRAEEDRKLLTYTSDPMPRDVEITGHPLVTLHVASTESDVAFIVYLEDVAPDGRVSYLTEGELRAVVRRETDQAPLYRKYGPHRTELRDDAMPLIPGEPAEIVFDLWATSALIREGHRILVAVAGADEGTFLRYPRDGGIPTLTVHRGGPRLSRIELPMRDR